MTPQKKSPHFSASLLPSPSQKPFSRPSFSHRFCARHPSLFPAFPALPLRLAYRFLPVARPFSFFSASAPARRFFCVFSRCCAHARFSFALCSPSFGQPVRGTRAFSPRRPVACFSDFPFPPAPLRVVFSVFCRSCAARFPFSVLRNPSAPVSHVFHFRDSGIRPRVPPDVAFPVTLPGKISKIRHPADARCFIFRVFFCHYL